MKMSGYVGKERTKHNPIARLKVKGKTFEIFVDPKEAKFFLGSGNFSSAILISDTIFSDAIKGQKASQKDVQEIFGTSDISEVAKKIIKEGHLEIPQEVRDEEKEKKIKQIVDFISKQAIDPRTKSPHTPSRIEAAIKQANAKIDLKKTAEEQAQDIISQISSIIPISIETKKIKINIPASFTGKVYGLLKSFMVVKEEWNSDGSLTAILKVPSGALMPFFDKLNDITHGAALTEEIK